MGGGGVKNVKISTTKPVGTYKVTRPNARKLNNFSVGLMTARFISSVA